MFFFSLLSFQTNLYQFTEFLCLVLGVLNCNSVEEKTACKDTVFGAEEPEWKQFPNNSQTTKINWTTNDITSDMYIFNMSADCNISNNQQSNIESLSQRQSRPR